MGKVYVTILYMDGLVRKYSKRLRGHDLSSSVFFAGVGCLFVNMYVSLKQNSYVVALDLWKMRRVALRWLCACVLVPRVRSGGFVAVFWCLGSTQVALHLCLGALGPLRRLSSRAPLWWLCACVLVPIGSAPAAFGLCLGCGDTSRAFGILVAPSFFLGEIRPSVHPRPID